MITCLWGISIIVLCWLFPNIGIRGQFGDSFGAINALFAGLAFAGVIFAIILQKKELELQRQELAGDTGRNQGAKGTTPSARSDASKAEFREFLFSASELSQ